ncbi:autotransporter-associated beta strand repeat-containing protein, partial [Luteolibacter marinus]|uniref:autotransporter-associated beta strand repeat-containing protein n=1 Tax=Luteolibacter marinus TaxID=2776705 RepID=UPI001868B26F
MTSHRLQQQLLALTLPVGCLLTPIVANGQSTWVGTTSTDWGTATNWVPGIPAENADIAIADATGSTNNLVLDTSHAIGTYTFGSTGTRTGGFTVQTTTNHILTLNTGIVANGAFTAVGPTMRGNFTVSADQTWDVAGASGVFSDDRGLAVRGSVDVAANVPSGNLVLNGNVTKIDTGAVMLLGLNVTGSGNLVIDQGALKLNAGGSQPLVLGGTGNITVNNSASLYMAKNSGTFDVTRPIVMTGTSAMSIGNGSNTTIASNMAWNGSTHSLSVASTYTFSGAWTGAATVNKSGGSELTLTGNNSGFTGTLNLTAGRVTFGSNFPGAVNLQATGQIGGEAVLSGSVALNGGAIYADPTTPGALTVSGPLTLTGTNTVNLLSTPAVGSSTKVLSYSGAITGGIGNLAAAAGFRNAVFSEPVSGEIELATGNASRTWNGGANWDIGISANWLEGDNLFYQADAVSFGDTGFGSVALTGNLAPSSITINNSLGNDYLFTAAGGNLISGSTGITKSGEGSVTLQGVNTFTGNIAVNAGTFKPGGNQALGGNGKTITVAAGAVFDTNGSMNANRDYDAVITGDGSGDG